MRNAIPAVVAILGFMWTLYRDVSKDMAGFRERMVRVESLLKGFIGCQPEAQS